MPPQAPPDTEVRDDTELARLLVQGDRGAFAALVQRHGGRVLRLAQVFVRDRALAEEVVQDSWLSVLESIKGFEGRASFKTWLSRIVANRAKTVARRSGRMVPFSALGETGGHEPAVDPERFDAREIWKDPPEAWSEESPERLALRAETGAVLEAAIAELPPAQRAVITLRDLQGLETDEICNILDVTVSNQRVLLHRARARVRSALERHMRGRG